MGFFIGETMPPTKREFLNMVAPQAHPSSTPYEQSLLRSAAVQAEHLTGDPAWDSYLTKLQARSREYQAQAEQWMGQLKTALSMEQVKQAQVNLAVCEACATVLQDAIALPTAIRAAARPTTPSGAVSSQP